ncbi:flagellar protein export ATPase FliI [Methylophaga sp. OBS1]|jgi:flagellum-specific ATP synthase|uniref:flagellar protein export ATPase FliI n=1 Tax=Methylophaga sp. OBS1 TaxID=2991933 RepID=UPI002255A429|nr:flagellar protein export ATPase FliI [Methylophaga sp. OBS1]MCX4193865.1 flagellar protein export ATPase FliI [Methylophaga sp. OBS1]
MVDTRRQSGWQQKLQEYQQRLDSDLTSDVLVEGRLTRMVGLTLEAVGFQAPVGSRCEVLGSGQKPIEAEVVGFAGETLYLMPTGDMRGLVPNARVRPIRSDSQVPVGDEMLGRVVDGAGKPLDGKGPLKVRNKMPLHGEAVNPLARSPVRQHLDVGVQSINALLSVGRGQRMGLFAGSGVGKSVLLGMMTRFTEADVIVVGLIGERGREVKEFIEDILGEEGLSRSVVVASPADHSPLMRLHGAMLATSIAEYFRDQGKQVLLLMDSLTRFAQAQREIALAIGEPPATKGYPPSVFSLLPQLVERAGNGPVGGGAITAIYTVLTEGDDQQDPVADAARAILDGHIVLSRQLAESGQYPAVDVEASISRVMPQIVDAEHLQRAQQFKQIYSTYRQNQDLISVGAYSRGSDPLIDEAIALYPALVQLLRQGMDQAVNWQQSVQRLQQVTDMRKQLQNQPHQGQNQAPAVIEGNRRF